MANRKRTNNDLQNIPIKPTIQNYSVFYFWLNRATNAKRFLIIVNYNNMAEKTFRFDGH
jgi:cytosine/uracil/thiamine/allantoin permease